MSNIPSVGKWAFWHEDSTVAGGWVSDGEYDAPKKEVAVRDGRTATTQFVNAVDGSETMMRQPIRSVKGDTQMEWWMHKTGSSMQIFDYLNWIIQTGVGLKIETHVTGMGLMGILQSVDREWMNWPDPQQFKVRARFKHFAVDSSGTGW